MTARTPIEREERRRRHRRQELSRWGVRAFVVVLVFAVGVAVGQALQDNPTPGRTVTFDRTVRLPTSGGPGSTITP